MKRSDSNPREAPWPPAAPQVAAAIFAATIQGQVTEEEIDAVDGLPPSKFPRELMIKLGFNPPPQEADPHFSPPIPDWPPSDERIDAAVVAAIRSGTIAEKELAMMRQASKLEWPDDLWHDLGFKTPADDLIPATVRISVEGTYHRIAFGSFWDFHHQPQRQ